ncbi:unnamed protein product [Brassicogethes aeneus]|uniref:MPN domain-containing protein n=1 Tax=Brassicogethes aeneus TaxID=1431903 RepID=A0A9P0AYV4_BRAAE|nr:unnamed protein product [Brassicogethes aeneus]
MKQGDVNMTSQQGLQPQERLKQLIIYSNLVDVDPSVPPARYYRSGLEMVRMANVYHAEGSLESAYVLYLKFMTLFIEKIRKHPEFNTVPTKMKSIIQIKLREILPKAEKLKEKLLQKYTVDYNTYQAELKKQAELQISSPEPSLPNIDLPSFTPPTTIISETVKPPSIVNVSYPDPDIVSAQKPTGPLISNKHTPSAPSIDRSSKPSSTSTTLDNYDKNILRTVVIPAKVMTMFQVKAATNTAQNIETCGILTGTLEKHELKITHLIIPKQKGTPDSCITTSEEEIFDIQDSYNLITIGWIHTHPTQTAFLSSVDLHTQCPYQLLMPEAIAIVCAPKYSQNGFFNLSEFGLKYISECTKTGFHPHVTSPDLFVVADHIKIDQTSDLAVVDLRVGNGRSK